MQKAIEAIIKLYGTDGGLCGGYAHIVFDDDNIEDSHIDWCIKECEDYDKYGIGEPCRIASLEALKLIKQVPYNERHRVINEAHRQITISN